MKFKNLLITFCSLLFLGLFSFSANAESCTATFTWEAAGSGNEAVITNTTTTTSTTMNDCAAPIVVDIEVLNPDGIHYTADGRTGTGAAAEFGQPGFSWWMDENNVLFDQTAMTPGDETILIFEFSRPGILSDFRVDDIDWRNGGVSASWQDKVVITATDAGGVNVPLSMVAGAGSVIILDPVEQSATAPWISSGSDGGLDANDPESQVTWSSSAELVELRVRYQAGPDEPAPGQQVIRIANPFRFTVADDADISVTKDDSETSYIPGGSGTYSILVSTDSDSIDLDGVSVEDILPAGLSLNGALACIVETGSAPETLCNSINSSVDGSGITTITANIDIETGGVVRINIPVMFSSNPNNY